MAVIATCCVCSCFTSLVTLIFVAWGLYLMLSSDWRSIRLQNYNNSIEAWDMGRNRPRSIPMQMRVEFGRDTSGIELGWTTEREEFFLEGSTEEPVSIYTPLRFERRGVTLYDDLRVGDTIPVRIRPSAKRDETKRIMQQHHADEDEFGSESTQTQDSSVAESGKKYTFSSEGSTIDVLAVKTETRHMNEEMDCLALKGSFDMMESLCTIHWKLVALCIVVNFETGRTHPMDQYDRHSFGCFENWQPEKYEAVTASKAYSEYQGSVTLRDYRDPLLRALIETDFTYDFGWSNRRKKIVGMIVIGVGVLPLVILGLSIYGLCTCCRAVFRRWKQKDD